MKIEILIDGEPYVGLPKQPIYPTVASAQFASRLTGEDVLRAACRQLTAEKAVLSDAVELWKEEARQQEARADRYDADRDRLQKLLADPMVTSRQAAIDHATGGKCAWSAAYEALGVAYNRLAAEVSDLKQENAAYDGRIVAAWAERDEARRDAVGYQQECAEYSKDVEAARGERNRYGKEAAVLRNQLEESREETNMYSDHAIATGKQLDEAKNRLEVSERDRNRLSGELGKVSREFDQAGKEWQELSAGLRQQRDEVRDVAREMLRVIDHPDAWPHRMMVDEWRRRAGL